MKEEEAEEIGYPGVEGLGLGVLCEIIPETWASGVPRVSVLIESLQTRCKKRV